MLKVRAFSLFKSSSRFLNCPEEFLAIFSSLFAGHWSILLSVALFLQMLSSLLGQSAQPNLSGVNCSDLSLSPVNAVLCSASLLALWQWLLPPCFDNVAPLPLGTDPAFVSCPTSLAFLIHYWPATSSLHVAYVPYSCTSFSLAYTWKPLPRSAWMNHTPELFLWYHMYKNSAELGCLQTPEHYLGLPYFMVSISFLSNLPMNLFCFVLCGCFGRYYLNLATSKYRESWSLVRIHSSALTLSNNSFV